MWVVFRHCRCHPTAMNMHLMVSIVALACLSGCAKSEPRACNPPDVTWRRPRLDRGLEPIRNKVTLDRDGKLYWNGSFVSHQQLGTMLNAAKKLSPQPNLYLEAEMGTPCRELDRVRHEVSEALGCRDTKGRCVEGLPDYVPVPYE